MPIIWKRLHFSIQQEQIKQFRLFNKQLNHSMYRPRTKGKMTVAASIPAIDRDGLVLIPCKFCSLAFQRYLHKLDRFMRPSWTKFISPLQERIQEITETLEQNRLKITRHETLNRSSSNVTHVVTELDENGICRRTEKYLQGIIFGKWIVDISCEYAILLRYRPGSTNYVTFLDLGLVESAKAQKWLPEEPFEAYGDSVLGLTHGPSRGRERQMAKVTQKTAYCFLVLWGSYEAT